MLCPHCHGQVNNGDVFCPYCGQKMIQPSTNYSGQRSGNPGLPNSGPVNQGPVNQGIGATRSAMPNSGASPYGAPGGANGSSGRPFSNGSVPMQTGPTQVGPAKNLRGPGGNAPKPPKAKKKINPILIAAIALVLVVVGGASFFIFGGGSGNSKQKADEQTLLGYLDEAQAASDKMYEDWSNAADHNDDTNPHSFRKTAEIADTARETFETLQTKTKELKHLDKATKEAADRYYSMFIASRKWISEVFVFIDDYLNDVDAIHWECPQYENYSSYSDYVTAFKDWYAKLTEAMDGLDSCPACVVPVWDSYVKNLKMYDDIFVKQAYALQYTDYLRMMSQQELVTRLDTADDNLYTKLLDTAEGETDHAKKQESEASALSEEIKTYLALDKGEREDFEFEHVGKDRIWTTFSNVEEIYPSLYNTYDALAVIGTGCVNGNRTIVVEAEIPGLTQKFKQTYHLTSDYTAIYIKPPALTEKLDLSATKTGQINIDIYEKDGTTLITSKSLPVTIHSRNDVKWYDDEYGMSTQDNILCFLTPESTAISQLKRTAIDEIYNLSDGSYESLVGYQNVGPNHFYGTYLQAAGIMRALYDWGVRYNNDTFSITEGHQHVLLPDEVLAQKSGLCIETTLVVASALQSAGFHTFLVFPPGHAQVAVEVWNKDDEAGRGQYFLIETTALSSNNNYDNIYKNFLYALKEGKLPENQDYYPICYYDSDGWNEYLSNCQYVIDCDDASLLGMSSFTS